MAAPWLTYDITSGFGDPDDVGGRRTGSHKGIDLATPMGTAITPVARGRVIQAGFDPRLGWFVKVQHSWGITTYLHGSRITVQQGDEVGPNTRIMISGSTGASTGPHTELRVQNGVGEYVDPQPIIDRIKTQSRLNTPPNAPLSGGGDDDFPDVGGGEGPGGGDDEFPDVGGGRETGREALLRAAGFFKSVRDMLPSQATRRPLRSLIPGSENIPDEELYPGGRDTEIRDPYQASGLFTRLPNTENHSLRDLITAFPGFSNISPDESSYQLPFFGRSGTGSTERAVRNVLRAVGIDTDIGNPYATFLEDTLNKNVAAVFAGRLARGEATSQSDLATDLVQRLQRGQSTPDREELLGSLNRIGSMDTADPIQKVLLTILATDPSFGYEVLRGVTGLPDRFEPAFRRSYARDQERFMNQAPELKNMGLADLLRQYLR